MCDANGSGVDEGRGSSVEDRMGSRVEGRGSEVDGRCSRVAEGIGSRDEWAGPGVVKGTYILSDALGSELMASSRHG